MAVAIFIALIHAPLVAFAFARSWCGLGVVVLGCCLLVGAGATLAYWSPMTGGEGYWQLGIVLAITLPVVTSFLGLLLGLIGLFVEGRGWTFNQRISPHFGLLAALTNKARRICPGGL